MTSLEVYNSQNNSSPWDALLRVGNSLRYLAIAIIIVLSVGIELIVSGQMDSHPFVAQWLVNPVVVGIGFGAVMLLTLTYIIGQERAAAQARREALAQTLAAESLSLARRFNPVLDFHHPEVCREILAQQASLAARLRAPISIVELNVPEMAKDPLSAEWRQFGAELARQVKATSRQTDAILRWTAHSYLLAMPEVGAEELPVIITRLHNDLEAWFQERFEAHSRPTLETRGITTHSLGQSRGQVNTQVSDILRETQTLLDEQKLRVNPQAQLKRTLTRREKSVGLTLSFNITGTDETGKKFSDKIVTQRVAADCIWFPWTRDIAEGTEVQVTDRDGTLCETATVIGFTMKDGERIAEVRFPKTPANWVM